MRNTDCATRNAAANGDAQPLGQLILQGDVSSVLALHAGALGDFVLTHHALARLRTLGPGLRIDVVARSPLAHWLAGRGVIDRAFDHESFGTRTLFADDATRAGPMRERLSEYDLILDFMGDADQPLAAGLRRCGAARAIHADPAVCEDSLQSRTHVTEQWLDSLSDAGLDLRDLAPVGVQVSGGHREASRRQLAQLCGGDPQRLAVIHPGSGGRAKCCPLNMLEQLVRGLLAAGWGASWMIGPTEMEWHGHAWSQALGQIAPLIYEENVCAAVGWILGADLYVGNDAGMTHAAAMLGVETVALFGPTDPRVWGPLGAKVETHCFGPNFERAKEGSLAVLANHPLGSNPPRAAGRLRLPP